MSFYESWQHRALLDISKSHLDAIDRSRIDDEGVIVGLGNLANLQVSTVFAAIAIEASINDCLMGHCLMIENPYLSTFFSTVLKRYLMGRIHDKISLIHRCWSESLNAETVKEAKKLFTIRNRIVHQSGEFIHHDAEFGLKGLSGAGLTGDELRHMLDHHEIAKDFLDSFWMPGAKQLQKCLREVQALREAEFEELCRENPGLAETMRDLENARFPTDVSDDHGTDTDVAVRPSE